jgi:hypothetical protein
LDWKVAVEEAALTRGMTTLRARRAVLAAVLAVAVFRRGGVGLGWAGGVLTERAAGGETQEAREVTAGEEIGRTWLTWAAGLAGGRSMNRWAGGEVRDCLTGGAVAGLERDEELRLVGGRGCLEGPGELLTVSWGEQEGAVLVGEGTSWRLDVILGVVGVLGDDASEAGEEVDGETVVSSGCVTAGILSMMSCASSGVTNTRRSSPLSEWVLVTERRPGVARTRARTPGPAIMRVR